jgi:hypothetical protein
VSANSLLPSAPLKRAASQEAQRLKEIRARSIERLRRIEHEATELRSEVERLDQQLLLLEKISSGDRSAENERPALVLRGSDLREVAAQVLLAKVGPRRAVHYKEWYDLVRKAGFVVLGDKPEGTFLTGVGRSPLVRRGVDPGTYLLDPDLTGALQQEMREKQAELHDVTLVLEREAEPSPRMRQHRLNLLASIRRLERHIDEADRVLSAAKPASVPDTRGDSRAA